MAVKNERNQWFGSSSSSNSSSRMHPPPLAHRRQCQVNARSSSRSIKNVQILRKSKRGAPGRTKHEKRLYAKRINVCIKSATAACLRESRHFSFLFTRCVFHFCFLSSFFLWLFWLSIFLFHLVGCAFCVCVCVWKGAGDGGCPGYADSVVCSDWLPASTDCKWML